ncbi:TetR family transcriptional regulator [Limosilactobacillus gastricus]|uniref:AcrR family transcriptional regulator n=1 Tax=Limosilactobacillus gastricus DSM 16045 TaxID=1423749 RepID=A0A0R1V864_9LACO|nr:TetR/AcrR family transcriptional regulator [Limosilactobacillus gastricus]KRM01695.1 AcrR family transcriptional regulator [Limosilactobacillus gastricus DSM 16045]QGF39785.1 TetR family transcriptional regulator [Limosilactobacillus gastricus]
MSEKQRFHHGDLKNAALREGLKIIETRGYQQVEIKTIAQACGVSSPSIYRHFKSKKDLMNALLVKTSELFYDYLDYQDDQAKSPKEELIAMGIRFIRFSWEQQHYFEFLFNSGFAYKVNYDHEQLSVEMNNHNSFSLFEKTVKRYLLAMQVKDNMEMHVINLWSYISGLAKVSDLIESGNKEQQLEGYVRNMMAIYTSGINKA